MSQFIYFTPEEKARAQNTDLVSLLRAQGERPVRSGREFRPPNDPSITVRGNKWFDHSARVGGYAVSFVQRYYRLPYPEAVLLLLGRKNGKSHEQAKPVKAVAKAFALPEPYGTMRRMYAYVFDSTENVTMYYQDGTSGWENPWHGRPAEVYIPE